MEDKIPEIDLAPLSSDVNDEEAWRKIGQEIGQAFHDYGFVYLKNNKIDFEKVRRGFEVSKDFFEQPQENKLECKFDNSPKGYHGQGYTFKNGEFDVRECFDFTGKMKVASNGLKEFYDVMQDLQLECIPLVKTLLKLIAIGLGLEDWDFFLKKSKWLDNQDNTPSFKTFRTLYYPAISEHFEIPEGVARVKEHSDFDFITLLFQDSIGGLEIKTASGKWIPATPIPDTVIVNIGDLLEAWTSGYFPSTKHRVLIPESEAKKRISRQSIAYFVHPDSNTVVKPILNDLPSFPEFKAYEHIKAKLASVKSY